MFQKIEQLFFSKAFQYDLLVSVNFFVFSIKETLKLILSDRSRVSKTKSQGVECLISLGVISTRLIKLTLR